MRWFPTTSSATTHWRGGPTADKEVLTFLAAHERALLVFSERELAGETETALAPVLALLVGTRNRCS